MPRRKAGGTLLPWLSARSDGKEGRFLQIGNSLFFASPFQNLNSGSKQLYFCMALEAGGKREVSFSRSTAAKYGIPRNSFSRHIAELKNAGFIEVAVDSSYWQFSPTVYRFVFAWKEKPRPQNGDN